MTTIDNNTVVVSDDAELRSVITGTNDFNYIFFDNNITLTAGIRIPISKPDLIIDGTYNGNRYTYTDMNSATATNSIFIDSLNSSVPIMNVTIKNMNIVGRNYYGIIYIYDSSYAANTTVTYKDINYVGCQIIYNNYGTTQFLDSTITIDNTTSSRQGEIGEVHKVEIGGNTTINHTFNGYNGFYFRGGADASFTILPNSNVNISLARNLFAGDNQLSNMTFGENSICTITAPNGLSFDSSQRVSNVLIDSNSTLNVYRTGTSNNASLYINNMLTINNGANVLIKSTVNNDNPHIYFYNTNSTFLIDNPACCIFFNGASSNFYFAGTTNIFFRSYQINQWDAAPEVGDIYNLPLYSWIKKNHSQIEFSGTATNTATNISSNNIDPIEDAQLPNVNLLQLRTLRVLSLGYLPLLTINRISTSSSSVSGLSVNNAGIKINHSQSIVYGIANDNGTFNVLLTKKCTLEEEIVVINSNNNFLYNNDVVIVEEPGELTLHLVPQTLSFNLKNRVCMTPPLYGRNPTDWTIQVYDSRVESSNWKLYATIEEDLKCETGETLPSALVYVDESSSTTLSNTPVMVYTGENNGGTSKMTDVNWNDDKGILFKANTAPIFCKRTYKTDITWILEE